jgi:anti-sigma regulatory factor (Ser/Thr protein kinase)
LIVTISDQAKQFNPISAAVGTDLNAPLDMRELGGMGIILIKQSTDAVEYKRSEGDGNTLILTKSHIS